MKKTNLFKLLVLMVVLITASPQVWATSGTITAASTTDLGKGNTPRYVVEQAGVGRLMKNATGSSSWTVSDGKLTTGSSKFALQTYNAISSIVINGYGTGSGRTFSSMRVGTTTGNYAAASATGSGTMSSTESSQTITITPASNIAANSYVEITLSGNIYIYSVELVYAGGGGGTSHNVSAVTSTGTNTYGSVSAGSTTVVEGGTTTITATPAAGYRVINWAVSGTGASISPTGASNSTTTTLTMGTANATVTVTFGAIPSHTITYTNTKSMDNSANPTSYYEGVGVASFTKLRHAVGYDFTGWSPSSISSSATTNQTIDAQWTARAAAAGTGTLTYALAFGTSTITTSSITRNNGALYDATDVSIAHTSFNDGAAKNGCSGKLTTTSAKDASNYVELTFKIADGYTFTPTEVQVRGNAVSTAKTMEVELKDNAATPNTKSVTGSLAAGSTDGGTTVTLDFDASGTVTLEGTVTLKIFVYGATNHWRLGTSIIVNGTVASAAPPSCSAPAEPTISGTTSYTYGGTITLTANCASGADASTTYTWYKGDTWGSKSQVQAAAVAGSNGHIYTKSAVVADAGTYWCEASNGTGCEAHSSTGKAITVAKADLTCTPGTGSASSITTTGATLPFTLTNTTGVGSVTIKIYNNSTDALVKTVSGITAATSGSQAVTDLSSNTTYYYKVTPIGDANHNDGSESAKSSTFTTLTQTYTVQFAASPNTYGTVSTSSVTVNEGTTVSSQTNNVLTVGSNTITATVTNDANYICRFANWVWSGHSWPSTVTSDMTISAVFTRKNIAPEITFSNDMSNIVTISNNGVGTIYYTTDGSTPTDGSTLYSAPFVIGENTTVKARVISNPTLVQNSDVASLTCTYTPTSYTVTYDGSDAASGDVPTDSNSPYTSGSTVTVLGNTGNLTKTFDSNPATWIGWNTNSNTYSGTHYDEDDQFSISGNTTLYAVWGYPIAYDADGGTINDASYPTYYICTYPSDGATTTLPSNVTKDGYTFVGWKTENGTGSIITEITGDYTVPFTGDDKLKAIWSEVGYSVTYAANGGSGSVPEDNTSYSPNAEVTVLGKNTLSKSGYSFCGWSYNGYVYVEGDKFEITEDATLTAVWNQNATTVTITDFATSNTNTSNNIPDDNSKYFYGYKGSVSDANALTITSNDGNDRGQNSGVEMRLTYNKKMRVYANNTTNAAPATFTGVTAISFKWKFIASGNSGKTELTSSYTVKVGSTTVADAVSITGKTNDGYATVNLTGLANLSGYIEIVFGGSSSSYNVYIDDIAITYSTSTYKKVSFNKGSGPSTVSGLPADRYVPSGSKISRPATDPTATNYIFDGWVTTSGGSTAFDFANTTITTDKTIYAKWTPKPSPGSGTVSGTANICPGSNTDITLSTSVSGASYQLYKDNVASGDPKPGTGSALTWSVSAAGTYTVKAVETATHASGNMSGSATVTIYTSLSKTSDPTSSKSATVGVGCALDGLAYTGNANVACQWQSCTDATPTSTTNISDGGAYSNCTTSAMTFTPASTGTYYFRCVVSDDCGSSFNTGVVTVTAKIAPNVYSLSGEPTALCGGTATLTLSGSDAGLTYKLYKGGVDQSDDKVGDGNEIEWTGIDAAGTYTVKTVETSTYAEATMSGSVTISIMTPTSITTQPTTSVTGHDGVNFTLGSNLVGAGEGTLTYQWYSYTGSDGAGEATVGSATTTKTLTTSKSAGTYYYKVEVIGSCGSVKSNMITVKVDDKHLLSFSATSGSGSVPGSAYYAPSASVTLNSTTIPTRSGYVFLGWNTNSTGTGDMYQPGATYTMPATATTLYAAWGNPCFSITDAAKSSSWSDKDPGAAIESSDLDGTITGGTVINSGSGTETMTANDTRGMVFSNNNREITITLTNGMFEEGTVISIGAKTNNSNSTAYGFAVSGNATSPATYTTTAADYQDFTVRYVVTADDGIEGTSSFTLKRANSNQVYLKSIYIGGCMSCTAITPTLSYDNTTLYAFGGSPSTATPTLTGNTGGGSVTWLSSNTDVITVNSSGVVTAVGLGSATVSAIIEPNGGYCGAVRSANFTVPALVTQTIRVGKSTSWNGDGSSAPDMSFNDPTSTTSQVAVIANSGYTFDATATSDKDNMTAKFTGTETTKGSKYVTLKFKNATHNLRLGEVIARIQPVTSNGKAQVEVYEGSTLRLTSSEVTDITQGQLNDVHFTFASPYVFAANTNIEVRLYFYGQTNGFRLGTPFYVNGAVLTDYIYQTSGNWSTAANWNWGKLPLADDNVTLLAPATVNTATAVAKSVVINTDAPNTGKLTIANNGVLTVDETITAIKSGVAAATAVNDVIIDCSKTSQGALIFEQPSSGLQTNGTVNFYTKSSRVDSKLQWQYVGYPFISGYDYDYGGYYINKYSETQGGWIVMRDQGDRSIAAWDGLAISGDDEGGASMTGTFVPTTGDKEFTLTYTAGKGKGKNLIGNSWTAPIQITSLSASDFGGARATIYIFNTGRYGEKETSPSGSWVTLPVEAVKAAPGDYDITVIPAFQGFQVKTADTEDKTLTLNYDSHVRPATNTMNKPLSAPARRAHSEISHISLTVESDVARQRVHLFEGADFSEAYDNGWDGDYVGVSGQNAYLYVVSPTLGKLAVDAENSLEGRIVALQSAAEKEYTFTFTGDETGYFLNDLKTENSTLISEGNSYTFTYEQGDDYNRFMISAMPFSKTQPTGLDDADWNGTGVQKVIYKDHMYIIRGGRVFDATGGLVK